MKWVTRQFVHVDRTACPWLIKKFVDPAAEFIFVPPEEIERIVSQERAIPFDTLNAELGHHGDKCSFDAIVQKYAIRDEAVLKVADIVRAADTNKLATVPEAAGLESIMTGIGISAKDDIEAVQKAAGVYDALYSACKLRIIRSEYATKIGEMDGKTQREFLTKKLNE